METITYLYDKILSIMNKKRCTMCGKVKSIEKFWLTGTGGRRTICYSCSYKREKILNELEDGFLRPDRTVEPEDINFKKVVTKSRTIPTDRDKVILNDILWDIQDFYGTSYSELNRSFKGKEFNFPRFHFFWFVEYYRLLTQCDNVPFKPTQEYVGSIFGRDHAIYWYGRKVIRDTIDVHRKFREFHYKLFDLVDYRLIKYNLGE